jgi:hypothetical protein
VCFTVTLSARKLFKLLVREAASLTGADKSMLTSYWRQRFVVGMRRSAMQGLRERAQNIFRSRIEDIHEEQDAEGLGTSITSELLWVGKCSSRLG